MPANTQTFESYRPLLFSIAYRMLGSAMEAEDMVQEAYLRFEKSDAAEIQSPKAYLTTIITRLCLDFLKSAKTQRENYIGTWLPEPILTGESPAAILSQHETISMAFLVLLENLSPIERAIFLMRDVFEYSYAEIAQFVGKNEANCRRYYHHAKQYVKERRPRFEASSDEQKKLVAGFMQAISSGNVEELTEMLAEDVILYGDGGGKARAVKHPLLGQKSVIRLLLASFHQAPPDTRAEIREINSTLSLLFWFDGKLQVVTNLVIVDNQIVQIYNILNPDKLSYLDKHTS